MQVFDYDRDDSVEKIGHCDTTLAGMMQPSWQAKLTHPKGKNKDVGTVAGTAIVRARSFPALAFFSVCEGVSLSLTAHSLCSLSRSPL